MRVTENIPLLMHFFGEKGYPENPYPISDAFVSKLISALHEQGIEINPEYSEKEVNYSVQITPENSAERTATVPLATKFPKEAKPTAFYLRTENGLELQLHESSQLHLRDSRGEMGPAIRSGNLGLICNLSLEGTFVDITVIDKVKKILMDYKEERDYQDATARTRNRG